MNAQDVLSLSYVCVYWVCAGSIDGRAEAGDGSGKAASECALLSQPPRWAAGAQAWGEAVVDDVGQGFSYINMHETHLRTLLKCRGRLQCAEDRECAFLTSAWVLATLLAWGLQTSFWRMVKL